VKKKSGKVYLVGAGPGDPGLLTLKAKRALEEADLVVYDYLANPEHLKHVRPGTKTLCVGKRFRHKLLSQGRINRLILEEARKGRTVVRLKGGDPYLFGRGGEEALYVAERGVPFEVVPGVTSAIACAAYAGIPLTHRDHNAAVTFLTGHRADDAKLDSIGWEKIVALGGTIAIYMGLFNLERIARKLIAAGLAPSTPVAVIEWGTLPRQRSVAGVLSDVTGIVRKSAFKPPCLIVIGEVVGLRKKLGWFERLPLFGKRIALTRPSDGRSTLFERLSALGADVVEFPVIRIEKAPPRELDSAIDAFGGFDWIVFSSVNGVRALFERLDARGLDARCLAGLKIASVGSATTQSLAERGLRADLEPERFETKAIVEEFRKRFRTMKGRRVMLLRADVATPELERGLERLGASVRRVDAYRTALPKAIPADVRRDLAAGAFDAVAFTSASTVRNFVRLVGQAAVARAARKTRFYSIGPVTTAELRRHGLKPTAQAREYTFTGLVQSLKESL